MKNAILTFLLIIMTTILYGQEISISVAPTINNALHYRFVAGGPGRNYKPGFSSSLDYIFLIDKKIKLGLGFCYQFSQVEYTPNMNTSNFTGQTDKVSLISINFATIYNLKRNFYLSLNPFINLQLNYKSDFITDKQNGLGLSFSIGKHFYLNDKIQLNIEPKIWINNIFPVQAENLPLRLTTAGLNLGLVFGNKKNQQPEI
jgi:hypothetical protein